MPVQQDFESEPQSAREVRRFVEEALAGAPSLHDIVLAASEFAANVIRHAQTPFTVRLEADDDMVRLEVSDGSSIIPAVEDLAESYRGLRMIEAVSERWGIEATDSGKTVWAEFSNTSPGRV
jgi:anti-sigma regulatory factor (Ser/Thr protein kinase)